MDWGLIIGAVGTAIGLAGLGFGIYQWIKNKAHRLQDTFRQLKSAYDDKHMEWEDFYRGPDQKSLAGTNQEVAYLERLAAALDDAGGFLKKHPDYMEAANTSLAEKMLEPYERYKNKARKKRKYHEYANAEWLYRQWHPDRLKFTDG